MSELKKITLILCDDEDLFREGLRTLIHKHEEFEIMGEADNGQELIVMLTTLVQENKKPDVVILDVEMPVLRGTEAAKLVRDLCPETRIVGLTGHAESHNIITAFKNGFHAYIHKDTVFEEVQNAIMRVLEGNHYLSPSLADKVVFEHIMNTMDTRNPFTMLTEREQAILRLFSEEKSPKEIAFTLDISRKTVDIHKKNIMKRLGIRTFAGLIKFCVKNIPTQ